VNAGAAALGDQLGNTAQQGTKSTLGQQGTKSTLGIDDGGSVTQYPAPSENSEIRIPLFVEPALRDAPERIELNARAYRFEEVLARAVFAAICASADVSRYL